MARTQIMRTLLVVATLALAHPAVAQNAPEVIADGLNTPIGVTVDADGRIWVAESGTGEDDGRVSIFADGTLTPFLTGMPSTGSPGGEIDGVSNILHVGDDVWIVGGAGQNPAFDLLRFSAAQFTSGATLTAADAQAQFNLAEWVLSEGYTETNIFDVQPGPEGSLIFTDAGANALFHLAAGETTPTLIATFDPVQTGEAPPIADPVPTGLLRDGDDYLIGTLTGFPFASGAARVYRVSLDGTVATPYTGLTMVNDVVRDPRDGRPVALEFSGEFTIANGFIPGTGRVVKLLDGDEKEVIADGLNLSAGLAFDADGTIYVTSLFGQLLRITPPPVANESAAPDDVLMLGAPWPNPFTDVATLPVSLDAPGVLDIRVFDVLGREVVRRSVDAKSGEQTVEIDGAGLAPGLYIVRVATGTWSQSTRIVRTR